MTLHMIKIFPFKVASYLEAAVFNIMKNLKILKNKKFIYVVGRT